MVQEEREANFRQAQGDQAYNLHLLDEHRRTEEQHDAGTTITLDVDATKQEVLLDSYRSARDICRALTVDDTASVGRNYRPPT
ncbi:hypothetical protein D1007_26180 [Hordeum vulgare]|nr:hypothetical protein D1007_26180 [Hordeum vulgare]